MKTPIERIHDLLHQLYPAEEAASTHARIMEMLAKGSVSKQTESDYFSEQDVTLITYGDSLQNEGEAPLQTLGQFLRGRLKAYISTLHLLPFYPYSSDDGFSVMDYYAVNPQLGGWDDIVRLGDDFKLMFDVVLNHMSARSAWFEGFLADEPAFRQLFMTAPPAADLSRVTRPRTTPLLTAFEKVTGETVHVWTTFSDDQVDLNYRDPETLLRMIAVLLFYVQKKAQVIRLDAVAFLWKEIGTTCLHLPQTHQIIQLMRAVLDVIIPHLLLITETNVPHAENISYFGDGTNEAQLVYNFTLPPLLLYTLLTGDARQLSDWVNTLDAPSKRTTFFNFTASHDGIGVRPVEGILTAPQLQILIDKVERSGGRVSYKANTDGTRSPYELNITYLDAVAEPDDPVEHQIGRFLVSQAVMLAMAGVPAIYIHSLLGSRNDLEGLNRLGYPRAINRRKLNTTEVAAQLDNPGHFRARVFRAYLHLIQNRRQSPAFHPNAAQRAFALNDGQVFGLERIALDEAERMMCLFNVTKTPQEAVITQAPTVDMLNGEVCAARVVLAPYQIRWLRTK